jgi:catecholate siderophore receptor
MARTIRLKPLAAAVAAVFGTLAPAAVLAQNAPKAETTLPDVNVTGTAPSDDYAPGVANIGRTLTPLRDVPQTVTVVNRAVMEAQGATSLADALRSVPGITIGAAEGGSIGNNFNLRGFSARTDLYLDGMRDRGQVYRDVFSLDSVEVLKGASSMLFGRGATGGVINQISKSPSRNALNEASITVGTQPSLRVTADMNQPLGEDSAFRVSLMGQDVSSTRDVMKNQDLGVAPSLMFGIGGPTEVTLSALLTHNKDMPDYGLPPLNGAPANVDRHNFYGATDDRTVQDVGQFTAKVKHKLSADQTLLNQTRYARYSVDARESGPNNVGTVTGGVYTPFPAANAANNTALSPSQLFVGIGSHDREITDKSLYNQTDLISRFQTGGIKHELLTGIELGWDQNDVRNSTRNPTGQSFFTFVNLADPAYSPGAGFASTAGNSIHAKAKTIAPYVNDTLTLSEHWKAVAGIRHDRYSSDLSNSVNAPSSASQTVDFNSLRGGVIFQPTLAQSYYVSYGTSFNPSLEALTLTNGQQSLDPEKNKSYEAGGKWDLFNGDLSLSSAVFQTTKTNARSQVSPGVYELTGEVRVRGFEAGAAGRITRNWQVLAGYTHLDAKIVSSASLDNSAPGNTLANTPKDSASAWTVYNVGRTWEFGTGLTYMSERFASNANTVKVPDYVRWDATVAYHQPKYDVRLNLLNLTNRTNYEQLIPSDRGRSVPSIDRTALLTLTYRY